MMSSAVDIDPTFKHALKLLHSGNSDSAEKIRNLLDELIKQRYGGNKTLNSTLSKKHLAEESTATGSNLYVRKQKPAPVVVRAVSPVIAPSSAPDSKQQSPAKSEPATESSASGLEALTVPPPPSGSIILSISDVEGNDEDDDVVMEEDQLKELEDLMCIVCKRMEHTARNRLVECADCHSLYHQECHKPVISEADANDQENAWFCTLCKGKSISKSSASSSPAIGSPAKVSSSSSHSKSSSSKNYDSSSSSSSKHKSSKSSKEGSSHDRDRDRDRDRERDRDRSDRSEREKDKEKSSSKSSSSGGGGGSGSSGGGTSAGGGSSSSASAGAGTPNINIISADKRLQMMKKKAAKLHDSKRKHK